MFVEFCRNAYSQARFYTNDMLYKSEKQIFLTWKIRKLAKQAILRNIISVILVLCEGLQLSRQENQEYILLTHVFLHQY